MDGAELRIWLFNYQLRTKWLQLHQNTAVSVLFGRNCEGKKTVSDEGESAL